MNTFLIILAIVAIGAAFYFYNIITGKIKDTDGDFIPDVVEEKVEDIKTEVKAKAGAVKAKAKAVKKEVADVKKAAKKVVEEAKDVVNVAKKPTKKRGRPAGSKNKTTK